MPRQERVTQRTATRRNRRAYVKRERTLRKPPPPVAGPPTPRNLRGNIRNVAQRRPKRPPRRDPFPSVPGRGIRIAPSHREAARKGIIGPPTPRRLRGNILNPRQIAATPPAKRTPEQGRRVQTSPYFKPDRNQLEQDIALAIATGPLPLGKLGLGSKALRLAARALTGGKKAPARALLRGAGRAPKPTRPPTIGRTLRTQAEAPALAVAGSDEHVRRALTIPVHTGRAFFESPGRVGPRTAKGLAEIGLATLAAPIELARHGPGRFWEGLKEDYSRRYGPLIRGEPGAAKELRERIKKEGAAPEALDILGAAALGGTTIGRGLGAGARSGVLGKRLHEVATKPRPRLRTSAGEKATRAQEVAPNLFRALGQRGEDVYRRRRLRKRDVKAARAGKGKVGLRPGEGEVVRAFLSLQRREQRIGVSGISASAFQRIREKQRHYEREAAGNIARLTRVQRPVVNMAIQGEFPLNPAGARAYARKRAAEIRQKRGETGRSVPLVNRRTNEELRVLRHIDKNAEKIFTPEFAKTVREEVERTMRADVENVAVRPETAEARRLRVQGEMLGVSRVNPKVELLPETRAALEPGTYVHAADRSNIGQIERVHGDSAEVHFVNRQEGTEATVTLPLEQLRPTGRLGAMQQIADSRDYIARVEAARQAAGLPEPGYVQHRPRSERLFSTRAPGTGLKGVNSPKQSAMRLYAEGRRDVSPQAYLDSLSRQIKSGVSWNLVADQFERAAMKHVTPEEMQTALGRVKSPDSLSIEDWRKILERRGLDLDEYAFVNPKILRRSGEEQQVAGKLESERQEALITEQEGLEASLKASSASPKELNAAFDGVDLLDMGANREKFLKTAGWYPVHKGDFNELASGTKPSGKLGRSIAKGMGFQSRWLLGTNVVSWLPFQVGANAFLTAFALRGNLKAIPDSIMWHRSLTPAQRAKVAETIGSGAMRGHGERMYLGATGGRWAQFFRNAADHPAMRRMQKYNPFDLAFHGDDLQNAFFRRAVLYNETKRAAYGKMNEAGLEIAELGERVGDIASMKPRDAVNRLIEHPEVVERLGERVDQFLGNWMRFSNFERRYLKRSIIFYGFFRFATRLAFYTMPIKHPVMMAIVGKLAQLQTEEVKDLLGGDEAPFAYSRIYFGSGDKLKSIDTLRANPVTTPILQAFGEAGPRALAGLQSPLGAAILNSISDKNLYTGIPFRVKGSATGVGTPGAPPLSIIDPARLKIFADSILNIFAPYRLAEKITQKGTQSDDAMLGFPQPIKYKRSDAIAREAQRRSREPSARAEIFQFLAPYVLPKPDYARETVQRRRKEGGQSVSSGEPTLDDLRSLGDESEDLDLTIDDLKSLR